MEYYDKLLRINEIRNALQDEESVKIFNARVNYMIDRDANHFYEMVNTLDKAWVCKELEDVLSKEKVSGIVIFGGGYYGRWTKRTLEKCGYAPYCFCDSDKDKVGSSIEEIPVISVNDLLKNYQEYLVIIGSIIYSEEIYQILLNNRFPKNKILMPRYGMLVAKHGQQYFDMYDARENETFVDGGAFDGATIVDFVTWSQGKYNKIFAFEPISDMERYIEKKIESQNIDRIIIYKKALWHKKEELCFLEDAASSKVIKSGTSIVEGIELDEVVGGEKITFLKLDVEGSELKALEGAKNTIKRDKPRLAICIYHKPEDVLLIPEYLLELVPDYKFYIRHYWSTLDETVLYANI